MLKALTTKLNQNKKKKKGFTLIELIIVIAIIAILSAIAIPKFLNVTKDANIKADIANAKTIQSTATMLIANGTIDISAVTAATALSSAAADTNVGKIAAAMQTVPKPKATGTDFYVAIGTDGTVTVSAGDATSTKQILPVPVSPYN